MKMLLFLSESIIPLLVLIIVANGIIRHRRVYEDFLGGARRGLRITAEIAPTLIGLMVAVGILRSSGFLDFLAKILEKIMSFINFPAALIPIALVKMFSSSAATGLLLDLYKQYGTDSTIGLAASIMQSSTETIFYTMSIYFMSVKVKKTRYTLAGALISTVVGIAVSVLLSYALT
jgi:spore maturation protein B